MNKNAKWMAIAGAVVVVAVIVAVVVHAGHKYNAGGNTSTGSTSDTGAMNMSGNNSSGGASSSTPTAADAVSIQNFAFGPANITVKVGDTVTWTNKDSTAHTVTADTASSDAPASGDVAPGSTYSFTFKRAGTYIYHCAIHPSMQGSVTVTQ
ncbi:MAG TPA: cupredoxin family copper-binding protein [Candidatus Saccharimonadales bacterium]|nr:cupredoxin family copper-binding protein [Candidatus Saccharimonadales bacterium]